MSVFIPGVPAPQGSAKAFPRRGGGVIVTHDNERTEPWRKAIRAAIHEHARDHTAVFLHSGVPVSVDCEFLMPRRKREPKTVEAHTRRPDTDKLVRAVLDALTRVVYDDDSQVVEIRARKRTAGVDETPGVHIAWREYRALAGPQTAEPFGVGVTGRPGVSEGLQTISGGAR